MRRKHAETEVDTRGFEPRIDSLTVSLPGEQGELITRVGAAQRRREVGIIFY